MSNTIEVKVRGYHVDIYGHVNNARYLEFLEEARWTLVEDRVDLNAFHQKGLAFFVVNININYRNAAPIGVTLEISAGVTQIGSRSSVMHQQVKIKGTNTIVVDADVTFVIVDTKTQKAIPLDGEIKSILDNLT